ncbi:hypothetical protein Tco_1370821, partial [Tanacetum coccineum]
MNLTQFTNEGQELPTLTFAQMQEHVESATDSSFLEYILPHEDVEINMINEEMEHFEDFFQMPEITNDAANLIHPPHDLLTKDPKKPTINTNHGTLTLESLLSVIENLFIAISKNDSPDIKASLKSLTRSTESLAWSTSKSLSKNKAFQAIMAYGISNIKTSFQDMLNLLQLAVSTSSSSNPASLSPATAKGEKLTKISPHKLLSTTFTGKYPFEESSHTCEPAHPEANTMVIYQGPTSTFGEERVWDYEICEHNSSVKPTKDIPTSYSTQPLEEKKDKQKMFGIEDSMLFKLGEVDVSIPELNLAKF